MQVKGSYLKDENGNIISPIVSTDTAFDANGVSITDNIGDIGPILDSLNGTAVTGSFQEKAVTISEKGTTVITPDSGYDAMSECSVTVNNIAELQEKTVTITQKGTTEVTPDTGYDGMSKCTVNVEGVAALQTKTLAITSPATKSYTITPDSGYDGISSLAVTVNVTPTVSRATYTSGINGNSTVTTFTYSPNNVNTHFWLYIYYQIGNTSAVLSSTITTYLQGSQDNSSWTNINSFAKTRGTTTTITYSKTWSNISGYKYYRIRVHSTDNETTVSLQNFRIMM